MASMPRNGSAKPSQDPPRNQPSRTNSANNTRSNNGSGGGGGGGGGAKRGGQSINHLLSFTLPPRARPPPPAARRSRRGGAGAPFNKERYINAQYRFLVKPTGDYTAYFADSDIYLHWADILQVLIPTTSALSGASSSAAAAGPQLDQPLHSNHEGAACPICLSPPTAPRMTKCGHVFCYPCILHYLTLGADGNAAGGSSGNAPSHKWRRCPICWDAVYARDLKAVRWWDPRAVAHEHQREVDQSRHRSGQDSQSSAATVEGGSGLGSDPLSSAAASTSSSADVRQEVLALRLIERPHLTTLALPQSSTWPASNLDHPLIPLHSAPWHFQPDVMGFAKFMLASPDLLIESLTGDLLHLEAELDTLKGFGADEVSLEFVRLAERKVKEQIEKVQTELDTAFVRSTIGQIKNDLKDHEAMESGRISKLDEQLSRRQRKRLEREQAVEDRDTATTTTDGGTASDANAGAEGSAADIGKQGGTDDSQGAPELAPGAEEFLALRSQSYGGNYRASSPAVGGAAQPSASDTASDSTPATGGTQQRAHGRHQHQRKNVNPPAPSSSSYLFFQAASGQNIFLHPLDIKIVLSHYGSYAALPRDLCVKVQGADEGSMNDELRRRCRYLSHVPMATDVVFIEVDWEAMDLVEKSTLRPYEQALRQRKTRRRDKLRREDRAKLRAEEAESGSRPGGLASSRPAGVDGGGGGGGGGGAAARRFESALSAFDSEANFPSDGLSRSYGSSSLASGGAGGYEAGSASPTFREAALWGAERDFPIHPGATEDFPDSLGAATGTGSGGSRTPSHAPSAGGGGSSGGSGSGSGRQKTVWGTPAARSAFDRALRGGGRDDHGLWDDEMDDAWHELEEDFIIGSTGSGRRAQGAVKEGRGSNRQPLPARTGSGSGSGSVTPAERGGWAGATRSAGIESSGGVRSTTSSNTTTGTAASGSVATGGGGGGGTKKKTKKKLVLTAGGRGTW